MGYLRFRLLIIIFLTEGTALLVALFSARWFHIDLSLFTKDLFHDILTGTVGALFPLLLFVLLLSKKGERIPFLGSLRKTVITDVKTIFSDTRFPDIVSISLIAGFAEEFLFRGIVQAKFGIIMASILFGLAHCITPLYAVIATIMGFYIGAFFYEYRSLLIPIEIHVIYDLGALIYLRYFVKAEKDNLN